ncbi:type IV pilin protein [Elusimicrobiota bacterium]
MRKSKGFTLIELMIVVAIIGILSAIAIPKFADLIRRSNEGATKGNLGAIRSAVSIYYGEQEGVFPNTSAVGDLGTTLVGTDGKYIKEMPECKTPPYHANSTSDVTLASANEASNPGLWGYNNTIGTASYGDVFVNCTHTDSRDQAWNTY